VRKQIQETQFDAVVAVYAPGHRACVAEDFVRELGETRLFDRVVLATEFEGEPDLIATITEPAPGSAASIPILSLLTLWVVPTWFDDSYGEAFELSLPPSGGFEDGDPVRLDSRYEGRSLMGFAATLINVLPNRGFRQPHNTRRYTEALAGVVVQQAADIERLLAASKAKRVSERQSEGQERSETIEPF